MGWLARDAAKCLRLTVDRGAGELASPHVQRKAVLVAIYLLFTHASVSGHYAHLHVNTKPGSLSLLVVLLLSLLPGFSFGEAAQKERVVASVTRIAALDPQKSSSAPVGIWMTIHVPHRLRGLGVLITTESRDRAKIRENLPIGSLQILELPEKTMKELEDQVPAKASIEETLDGGIFPVSQLVWPPSVRITDLARSPVAYRANTEQAEQNASGQPATQ